MIRVKRNFFTTILLFLSQFTFAQEKYIQWQSSLGGRYSENANAVVQTSDKGYIIVGSTNSKNSFDVGDSQAYEGQGGSDYWVVKLDVTGKLEWSKTFGGSDDDVATDIVKAHNGDYVIIGTTVSTDGDANFNGTNGGLLIIRIKENGDRVSSRVIPGGRRFTEPIYAYADNFSRPSIVKLANGDLMIGATREVGQSPYYAKQFYLSRLTPFGDTLWERQYGSTKDEVMADLLVTSDGGILMIGSTNADAKEISGAGKGFYDFFAVKTDQNGVELWRKAWGGANFDNLNGGIETNSRDGYLLVGESSSKDGIFTSLGQKDAVVIKVDQNGNLKWTKNIGGELNEALFDIVKGNNNTYLAIGTGESQVGNVQPKGPLTDVFTVSIDENGIISDYGLFGGADIDIARGGMTLSENEMILVGTSRSESDDLTLNHGENDMWVFKIGPPPPVIFGVFFSNLNDDQNGLVEWSTRGQNNAKKMILEKSTDNKTFSVIREFDITENTKSTRLYSYVDKKMIVGNNYYRLKYTDINDIQYNGPNLTFNFIPLNTSPEASFLGEIDIFPNPATEKITIRNIGKDAVIKMINTRGILSPIKPIFINQGWEIPVTTQLTSGSYILSIVSEGKATSHKIVVL
ncbi:Por secretion system C-terminal sorting domain-containing protein [Spirosomataceae bacterium TFI 002]|nr:Por secretion system C-terminal sorting domain-containing protein [Spirosomataceae bacterium TFI 002]